jgi:hypothetical protein
MIGECARVFGILSRTIRKMIDIIFCPNPTAKAPSSRKALSLHAAAYVYIPTLYFGTLCSYFALHDVP